MTSFVLQKFRLLSIDIPERVSLHRSHPSYAGNLFKYQGLVRSIIPSMLDRHTDLIEEYILTLIQTITLGSLLYLIASTLSFLYFFKWKKQKFLPKYDGHLLIFNDIKWSLLNIWGQSFLVAALRMTLPRYSLIYYRVSDYSWSYLFLSIFLHIVFDETLTYWVHRIFHTNNFLYRHLHKIHHRSVDISPFSAGFAFHPLDAFGQAVPTFVSCFFFPLHYDILLFFSFITSLWAVSIHDNVPALPIKLFLYSTHHTIHHERGIGKFRNYGKFTSVWDRLGGTYLDPDRIDYGWCREENTKQFFRNINYYIEKYIPDRTKKTLSAKNLKSEKENN